MPIHYASILNSRNVVVLEGVDGRTQTKFTTKVVTNAAAIQRFGYAEVPIEGDMQILYHNWDTVTAAIVASKEVDKQELCAFIEKFKNDVETQVLGNQGYKAPMNGAATHEQEDHFSAF